MSRLLLIFLLLSQFSYASASPRPIPSSKPLSPAQLQAREVLRETHSGAVIDNQLNTLYFQLYNQLWNNSLKLTPAQVLTNLGTRAGKIVTELAILKTAVLTLRPNKVLPVPPHTILVNADGSASIGP